MFAIKNVYSKKMFAIKMFAKQFLLTLLFSESTTSNVERSKVYVSSNTSRNLQKKVLKNPIKN